MVTIIYLLGTKYLSSCGSNLYHVSLVLVYKTFPLKKGAREPFFQLFTKKLINDSLMLESFRATVQPVGLF